MEQTTMPTQGTTITIKEETIPTKDLEVSK